MHSEIFLVVPPCLFGVEFGSGLADFFKAEGLDKLLHREDLLLCAGIPAEHRQQVDKRPREVAVLAVAVVGLALGVDPVEREYREAHLVAVPLGKLAVAHRLEQQWQVGEARTCVLPAQCPVKQVVERQRRQPLLAADDFSDLHQVVVHDVGEVVGRELVGPLPEHLVVESGAVDFYMSPDEVVHTYGLVLRHLEPDGPVASLFEQGADGILVKGQGVAHTAASEGVVDEGLAATLGLGAGLLKLLGGVEGIICIARSDQLLCPLAVDSAPEALAVRGVRMPLRRG